MNYTSLRRCAGFFAGHQSVTVTDNLHTSLHFPSFLCVFSLAKSRRADHNEIAEVLIGEIIGALSYLSLAPTCADAQVFFRT